jgi:hypothetical protein
MQLVLGQPSGPTSEEPGRQPDALLCRLDHRKCFWGEHGHPALGGPLQARTGNGSRSAGRSRQWPLQLSTLAPLPEPQHAYWCRRTLPGRSDRECWPRTGHTHIRPLDSLESRSPLRRLGSPRQFLSLPATAFLCLTFAVWRVARRPYIFPPARSATSMPRASSPSRL